MVKFFFILSIIVALSIVTQGFWRGILVNKQIDILNVYMPIRKTFPDPANIINTGQWYLLDHTSSSLAHFDHIAGKFKDCLATIESYSSGSHSFTLLENARFHDGTKITSEDVVASIKRLLILKTSTHFPLWDYIEGCENLKSMTDDCSGLKAVSDRRVDLRLKSPVETFILQMASPETGIWYHGDIDSKSEKLEIKPTKFSGPYFIESITEKSFELKRNEFNPISQIFPNSPKKISIKIISADKVIAEMKADNIDVVIRSHNPYDTNEYKEMGFSVFSSSPATLLYLHGAGTQSRNLLSRQFIETLWRLNTDPLIVDADNFLPFDPSLSITRREFLNALPEKVNLKKPIRIGVPWTYLSQAFYQFIKSSAEKVGMPVEIIELDLSEWTAATDTSTIPKDIDYVLGIYAASERYPAVQLRYITGTQRGPKIDLKLAEQPELTDDKKQLLHQYQIELLTSQFAVPLFFSRHQITYRDSLDVGDQPPSDAEVELWRLTKR